MKWGSTISRYNATAIQPGSVIHKGRYSLIELFFLRGGRGGVHSVQDGWILF